MCLIKYAFVSCIWILLGYCYITGTTHTIIVSAEMKNVTLGVLESDFSQIRVCVPYDSTRRSNLSKG